MSKKQLTVQERLEIFDDFESGVKKSVIRRKFGVSARTIYNICNNGRTTRKKYDNSKRFSLNEQDKVDILRLVGKNSSIKLDEIANQLSTQVSTRTIERFLERTERERQNFERSKSMWNEEQWRQTIFTDECAFSFNVTNYCKKYKKQITVNVYGLISWHQSAIFPVSSNFDEYELYSLLCADGFLDHLKLTIPGPINFLQDNSKLHLVKRVRNLLVHHGLYLAENYSAYTPENSAIEGLWRVLKPKVTDALLREDPDTEEELFAVIKRCFETISQETIRSFIMECPLVMEDS